MALVDQSQEMKDAYGQNFSQQDLTDPQENQVPQYLETPESESGGLELAKNKQLLKPQNVNRSVPKSTVQKAKKVTK